MGAFTYTDLVQLDLGKLQSAAGSWKTIANDLAELEADGWNVMKARADQADWVGSNAEVTRDFVGKTAKELTDLAHEAHSIWSVIRGAHRELDSIQSDVKKYAKLAREEDPALLVIDGGDGTVRVEEAQCTRDGPNARTKGLMQWYADVLTDLVAHAAETDEWLMKALRKSHGNDPHNAGHATYTSLDEVRLPRTEALARLGENASTAQRDELRRLWTSLSDRSRAELWVKHKKDLIAAGIMSPTTKQVSADEGSGPYDSESPGMSQRLTREKMRLIAEGADWGGMSDAGRHMAHYLNRSGDPMELPVNKMMEDDKDFRMHIDATVQDNEGKWRRDALDAYEKAGRNPVAIPVETDNAPYSFSKGKDPNWYFAVGSANTNVSGVVSVVPGADGKPKVSLDYQANVWDRYNWDEGKGVNIGPMDVPDGEMARLHRAGLAQEFDMSGSGSPKEYELTGKGPGVMPQPDEHGREGTRTDPGREGTYR